MNGIKMTVFEQVKECNGWKAWNYYDSNCTAVTMKFMILRVLRNCLNLHVLFLFQSSISATAIILLHSCQNSFSESVSTPIIPCIVTTSRIYRTVSVVPRYINREHANIGSVLPQGQHLIEQFNRKCCHCMLVDIHTSISILRPFDYIGMIRVHSSLYATAFHVLPRQYMYNIHAKLRLFDYCKIISFVVNG